MLRRAGSPMTARETAEALIADKAPQATRKQATDLQAAILAAMRKRNGGMVFGEGAPARWQLKEGRQLRRPYYLASTNGVKVCASHRSTMAERRTESYLPSLKNTEYTNRLDCSEAPLLRQIIHGADEIGLAAIGPATSSGSAIFSIAAAFFSSGMTAEM